MINAETRNAKKTLICILGITNPANVMPGYVKARMAIAGRKTVKR
jgi:hypothetical protein